MDFREYIDVEALEAALAGYHGAAPFDHCVVDGFLRGDWARRIEAEFPAFEDKRWFAYSNPLEEKKALNDWNAYPEGTYGFFSAICHPSFLEWLGSRLGLALEADPGLHGGGFHMHGRDGNLNPHLDYNIHPKMGLQRKLNIIVYLSSSIREEHGGHLGLWRGDAAAPGELAKEVFPVFNRAILFDTTQNSWHGMSRKLMVPEGVLRKSLAAYFLQKPEAGALPRLKARYAPREEQREDASIQDLIARRAEAETASRAWRSEKVGKAEEGGHGRRVGDA